MGFARFTAHPPSFFVFPDTQCYKCFGCGAGGDLPDFVMQREGWDMDTALRELAMQVRVEQILQSAEEKHRTPYNFTSFAS